MDKNELYDRFEQNLNQELLKLATSAGFLDGTLPNSPDFDDKWEECFMEPYVSDAVKEFNAYPEVALAWAAFLGMGAASRWDLDWKRFSQDDYGFFLGKRGFDDMDEHILRDILKVPLASAEASRISSILSSCAQTALGLIRHEGIEAASIDAYFIFLRCCRVFYNIGVGIQLNRMGYRMVPMSGSGPLN